ncbi:hypothetical protein ATCV1_z801R [Acanthocystis turfacea chlorella virus 1]|uniref:Uncharacterized protein z801R n=1 Tax=Chlorovirus heliozoae TaxID=322019 RepID=A7KA61_9PHYC|nr:hypothetical protein ATCV1_z801R [Acanthocystis turfacea chlorella virus 1]ABT16935.1 hypothetical protein ATCV1_z801R [Acanthocystis turfacea chlorella virus 1]
MPCCPGWHTPSPVPCQIDTKTHEPVAHGSLPNPSGSLPHSPSLPHPQRLQAWTAASEAGGYPALHTWQSPHDLLRRPRIFQRSSSPADRPSGRQGTTLKRCSVSTTRGCDSCGTTGAGRAG